MNKNEFADALLRDIAGVIERGNFEPYFDNADGFADEMMDNLEFYSESLDSDIEYLLDSGKYILEQFRWTYGYDLSERLQMALDELEKCLVKKGIEMTVGELLDLLDGLDEETEVRLAMQPRWAFEYTIGAVAVADVDGEEVVFLGEGQQTRYLPEEVAIELGWK